MTLDGVIQAVIFDMDDLMINSHPAHMQIMESVLKEIDPRVAFYGNGTNSLPEEEEASFFGLKIIEVLKKLADRYGVTVPAEQLNIRYNQVLLRDFGKVIKQMDGLSELITELKDKGYKLAVASSAPRRKIDIVLDTFGYSTVFEAIVSGEDEIKHGKPAPDIFLKAAEKLGIAPSKCLVLEDAKNGIEATKAAGMYCIGVHNQFAYERLGIRQDLSKADRQVESLKDVSTGMIARMA